MNLLIQYPGTDYTTQANKSKNTISLQTYSYIQITIKINATVTNQIVIRSYEIWRKSNFFIPVNLQKHLALILLFPHSYEISAVTSPHATCDQTED
jgi:hypothetical protein